MSTKLLAAAGLLVAGFAAGRATSPAVVAAAPQAPGRVFELRTYTATEGKLANVNARFRDHTRRIFDKHHMTSIGYWTPSDAPLSDSTLIYIIAHPSRDEAKKNWAEFSADPEWQKVKAESEAAGRIVAKAESVFLTPTDYSAIK
jgi:NIPSNAP